MAKKYLDDTGMSYFWGKLKAYFQPKLVSGTNIKTINSTSLLGSGDIEVPSPADYVIEQGTSGIWTYRKWNSGIAECWGSYSFSVSGNRPQVTPPDYPSGLFTAKPTVNTSQEYSGGSYGFWLSTGGGSAGTELRPPKYTIYTDASASTTTSGTLYFNAHGKWK